MFDWTDDRHDELKLLWADGLSASEIGEKWGVSRNSIIGKVHRLKLPKRAQDTHNGSPVVKRKRKRVAMWRPKPPLPPPDINAALPFDQSLCAVTFMQLIDPHCRWPLGDPQSSDFKYCGAQHLEGSPYCARHHLIAYQPARQRAA